VRPAALGDVAHVERSRALNLQEKVFLDRGLRDLGLSPVPSQANFLLVDVHRDAQQTYRDLLRHGVIVRALAPLPTCLRITLGTRAENERCLAALRTVLG
jgi:histidinol-phosphate aminotransferase